VKQTGGGDGADLCKADRRTRALEALALCGISDLADRKPGTLSGGQQQRIA
jgi:ABC-type sulfate/molybdate transport systems ATPase subunit